MKKQTALCIILFLCLLSCARQPQKSGQGDSVEIPEWFNTPELRATYLCTEGVRIAASEEEPSRALPYFEKVLEIDSLHASANFQLGRYYYDKDAHKTLQHSKIAHKADTANVDYLTQYCMALVVGGKIDEAKVVSQKLIALDPKNPSHYNLAALLYTHTNMPYMAIAILDSAKYKLGYIPGLEKQKIDLLTKQGLYDRAVEELKSDIANHPFETSLIVNLGNVYRIMGRDSLAEATLLRALEISPQSVEAQSALAAHYHATEQDVKFLGVARQLFLNDEATLDGKLYLYDTFVVKDDNFYRRNFFTINSLISILNVKYPNNLEISSRYAKHLIAAGEVEKSLAIYQQIAEHHNHPLDVMVMIVDIERYLGRRDSMLHYLDVAIAHHPTTSDLYLRKAYELMLEEESPKCQRLTIEAFEKAIEVASDSLSKSNTNGAMGDYLIDINPNKGFRYYRRALDYNPDNSLVLNNWAYHLCEHGGDLQKALSMSTRACELTPTNANHLDTKAWVLHRLGRNEEAKTIMRQAISLDSNGEGTFFYHYAEILAALGDHFMAEIYYRRALDAGEEPELMKAKIEELKTQKERE